MAQHNELGKWGEEYAAVYLAKRGYTIVERNWRHGHRDIDIIATSDDGRTLVFVEVKTRKQDEVMDPAEAVTPMKMKSIGQCANRFVKELNIDSPLRFDIITIVGSPTSDEIKVNHIEEAFNPCRL